MSGRIKTNALTMCNVSACISGKWPMMCDLYAFGLSFQNRKFCKHCPFQQQRTVNIARFRAQGDFPTSMAHFTFLQIFR